MPPRLPPTNSEQGCTKVWIIKIETRNSKLEMVYLFSKFETRKSKRIFFESFETRNSKFEIFLNSLQWFYLHVNTCRRRVLWLLFDLLKIVTIIIISEFCAVGEKILKNAYFLKFFNNILSIYHFFYHFLFQKLIFPCGTDRRRRRKNLKS